MELTRRQKEVLDLLAEGKTNAEIAARLGITLDGAKFHVSEILTRLGAHSREEAASYWREERRLSRRISGLVSASFLGFGVKALGAGVAALVVAAAAMAVVIRLGDNGPAGSLAGDATPTVTPEGTAPPTTTATPIPPPTTAEEILQRSSEAMSRVEHLVFDSLWWPLRHPDPRLGDYAIESWEFRDTSGRRVAGGSGLLVGWSVMSLELLPGHALCQWMGLRRAPFSERELGALPVHGRYLGASAPGAIELLGEEAGAWVLRYRYTLPTEEGPFPVEHTEWVEKGSLLLSRLELEFYDPFGPIGQAVHVFDYGAADSECPRPAPADFADLAPRTERRIEGR